MDIEAIRSLINSESYDFLRENPHVKDKIIFLTLGGSHAYGTNVETSDVDIRGCALNSPSDLIGLSNFEQLVNSQTDTTVYSFNKLISLLLNCNPNTIELLGCKPEHYFIMTYIGRELINARKMFLSQRAVASFGGYATQQLRRLENALARDKMPQDMSEKHIQGALQRSMSAFEAKHNEISDESIKLYTDKSDRDDKDIEVFCDINIKKYPIRDFSTMLNTLTAVVRSYDKLNHRNHKKDDEHLNKHAMHLIRLYLMCFDILEKEDIITYRADDRDLLLDIRKGKYQNEDGTYRSEFFDLVSECEKRLQYDKQNTSLPQHPNMKRIEEFVMSVNRRSLYA